MFYQAYDPHYKDAAADVLVWMCCSQQGEEGWGSGWRVGVDERKVGGEKLHNVGEKGGLHGRDFPVNALEERQALVCVSVHVCVCSGCSHSQHIWLCQHARPVEMKCES